MDRRTLSWLVFVVAAGCARGAPFVYPGPFASVTLHVYGERDGQPISGADVYFHTADGDHIVDRMVTASDGRAASARAADGGSLTVLYSQGGEAYARTIFGVRDGDDLRIGSPRPAPGALRPLAVGLDSFAGATSYAVHAGCANASSGGPLVSIPLPESCGGSVDVVAFAESSSADAPLAFLTATVSATAGTIALSGWRTDFATIPVTLETTGGSLVLTSFELEAAGSGYPTDATLPLFPGPTPATTSLPVVPGFGEGLVSTVWLPGSIEHLQDSIEEIRRYAPVPPEILVGAIPLARPTALSASRHRGRVRLDWETSDPGDESRIEFDDPYGSVHHDWVLIAPPEARSIVLPALPLDRSDFEPASGGTNATVEIRAASWLSGYDAARNAPLDTPPAGETLQTATGFLFF